jgi:hypothetical protein
MYVVPIVGIGTVVVVGDVDFEQPVKLANER